MDIKKLGGLDMFKKNTKHKKMEFSKKMYLFTTGFAIFCVLVTFVLIAFSGFLGISDLSVLGVIITSCFAEVSVHSGFYIWKAKYENGRKYNCKKSNRFCEWCRATLWRGS